MNFSFFAHVRVAAAAIELSVNAGDSVTSVDVYPYGEIFATGTASGKARLWDSADASKPMNTYRGTGDGAVTIVRFTPGGESLVVGHANGALAIWSLTDKARAPAPVRAHHKAAIVAVAFHPSDALVATADAAGVVRLFALDEADGALIAVGAAAQCFSAPVKALCFVGAATLAAVADASVVALAFAESSLTIAARHAAPALATVFAAVPSAAAQLFVCAQMQNPGGVCLWRVDLAPKAAVAAAKPAAAKPAAAAPNKENAVVNRVVQKAAAPPSEERRVLDQLLQGHKPVREALESRARKFEAAVQLLQVAGARLADALKALQASSDVVVAATVLEQLATRANEHSSKLQYGAALTLAEATLTLCSDVLTSWDAKEAHVCAALTAVEQLAKWCDIRQTGDLEAPATACQARMAAVMRLLKNENSMPLQLTPRARELREKCLKFEKYY